MSAPTFVKGVDGGAWRGNRQLFGINSYTINVTNGTQQFTPFGQDGVGRVYTGITDFTGTLNGSFPRIDTSTGGTVDSQELALAELSGAGSTVAKATYKFLHSTVSMWWGSGVLITDWSITNESEGIVSFTASFASDGRMTLATSTST